MEQYIDNMYQDKIMGGLEGDPLTNISNQFAISGPWYGSRHLLINIIL